MLEDFRGLKLRQVPWSTWKCYNSTQRIGGTVGWAFGSYHVFRTHGSHVGEGEGTACEGYRQRQHLQNCNSNCVDAYVASVKPSTVPSIYAHPFVPSPSSPPALPTRQPCCRPSSRVSATKAARYLRSVFHFEHAWIRHHHGMAVTCV